MIFTSLLAKLGFDSSSWTSGTASAKKDLVSFDGAVRSTLSSIKGQFGKSSVMAQLGKLFVGGGAVAGLKMVSNEILHFADAWVGTTKAAEAASDASKHYNDVVKAISEGKKEAMGWELEMTDKLRQSYLDLDDARHPENKAKNALTKDLEAQDAALEKQKQKIRELDDEIKASKNRRDIAQKDLAPMEKHERDISQTGENSSYFNSFLLNPAINALNGRKGELEKIFNDEQNKMLELTNKKIILSKQVAADEFKNNEIKNNLIAAANETATAELIKNTEKAMMEKRRISDDNVDKELAYRKKQIDNDNSSLEEQKKAIQGNAAASPSFNYQAQQTESIRNASQRVVIDTPKINDPQKDLAKQTNILLKSIDKRIAENNKKKNGMVEVQG